MPHKSYSLQSNSDDDESHEDPLEEQLDWDSTQHHREVTLEYYKKRRIIGAEAARASRTSHTHDDEEWNQAISVSFLVQPRNFNKSTTGHRPTTALET
ncbi:hypothetical protein BDR04DRAFT_1087653 [Suillus decipiens]|nr:hypothetical protein BDR04DRAFT_1087653 [Suillus decipiens]